METKRQIGIWMDHSVAHLILPKINVDSGKSIESEFTQEVKEQVLAKSEHMMHNKEQHQQSKFYEKIADVIRNYNDVVLFGPTTAKDELHNLLKKDHLFEKINIEVQDAGKMTENQQHAFVKSHFHLE